MAKRTSAQSPPDPEPAPPAPHTSIRDLRVLVVASRKGGAGKTTLASHLSVEAERAGAGPVGIVDTDPMQGLAEWWDVRRHAEQPMLAQAVPDLAGAIDTLRRRGCKLVIVDTPPASTIGATVRMADLVIIPVQPSPDDLRAVGRTVTVTEAERRPMLFVLNRTKPRVRMTDQAARNLSQYGTVAPMDVHDRSIYAAAKIEGHTAPELEPDGPAAAEMADLWRYVAHRLEAIQ